MQRFGFNWNDCSLCGFFLQFNQLFDLSHEGKHVLVELRISVLEYDALEAGFLDKHNLRIYLDLHV